MVDVASPPPSGAMPLREERDSVMSRQLVRKLTQALRFSLVDQPKMVTATSELSRNTVVYGRGGEMRWEVLEQGAKKGLRLVFADKGPGIADLNLALTDGWTSGSGMGMGLSGSKRLVQEFEIDTTIGAGTRVTIARWR